VNERERIIVRFREFLEASGIGPDDSFVCFKVGSTWHFERLPDGKWESSGTEVGKHEGTSAILPPGRKT
jgi:hypothetical protein